MESLHSGQSSGHLSFFLIIVGRGGAAGSKIPLS